MSKSAGRSTGGKCCLAIVITLVIIIVLLGVAVGVVLTLTPAKVGIENTEIAGTTLAEMGLADTKFVDIIKDLVAMSKANEDEIVTNAYSAETESTTAAANMEGSSLSLNAEGGLDYSSIFSEKVTYSGGPKVKTYQDTTIAYILNQAVHTASAENTDVLRDANIDILQVSIVKMDDNNGMLVLVGKIVTGEFTAEMDENVSKAVPDNVYISIKAQFHVGTRDDTAGQIIETSILEFALNGMTADENAVSKAVLTAVAKSANVESVNELGQSIVDAVTGAINHLGKIASADKDANDTPANVIYGMSGVQNHQITVITYQE